MPLALEEEELRPPAHSHGGAPTSRQADRQNHQPSRSETKTYGRASSPPWAVLSLSRSWGHLLRGNRELQQMLSSRETEARG